MKISALDYLKSADTRLFLFVSRASGTSARQLARLVSRLADGPVYIMVGIYLAFTDSQGAHFLQQVIVCYALQIPLYVVFKKMFKRQRPFRTLQCWCAFTPADEFSFPSGHTAAAAVFAGLSWLHYGVPIVPLVLMVFLVGAARVVLGVHYPGDILAGALLGLACVAVIA